MIKRCGESDFPKSTSIQRIKQYSNATMPNFSFNLCIGIRGNVLLKTACTVVSTPPIRPALWIKDGQISIVQMKVATDFEAQKANGEK